ncbi:MAG: hypothetical protein JSW65_07690 [Candidatus Bipolaricaulota bacterium]|nr:MAG: hypothetical protein JSW65_07690 [Candidatus Bipolaricaulota bacterium]
MTKERKPVDRGGLAIGGTTLIGVGVGFVFLQTSALLFVASILMGVGVGLLIAAVLPDRQA